MFFSVREKMSKESRIETERSTICERPQSELSSENRPLTPALIAQNMVTMFTNDYKKISTHLEDELKKVKSAYEELQCFEDKRTTYIEEMKSFLEKKTEIASKLRDNVHKLKSEMSDIAAALEKEKRKYVKLEVDYDKHLEQLKDDNEKAISQLKDDNENTVSQLKDDYEKTISQLTVDYEGTVAQLKAQIEELESAKADVPTLIMAKEAECNEKAAAREALLENEISELKAKVTVLEEKLQDHEQEAEQNKESIAKYQVELSKKTAKLLKKDKRVKELKEMLEKLETENKELVQKFETQGFKMRELQNVLHRPNQRITFVQHDIQTTPLNSPTMPSHQSALTASPDNLVNNTQIHKNTNDNDEENSFQIEHASPVKSSSHKDLNLSVNRNDGKCSDSSSNEDFSDDFDFPPFRLSGIRQDRAASSSYTAQNNKRVKH